jgi:hypothetical protein
MLDTRSILMYTKNSGYLTNDVQGLHSLKSYFMGTSGEKKKNSPSKMMK